MTNQPNAQPTMNEIAACAHSIWENEGRPQGREVAHWLQAEQQLSEFHAAAATVPTKSTRPPASRSIRRSQGKRQKEAVL